MGLFYTGTPLDPHRGVVTDGSILHQYTPGPTQVVVTDGSILHRYTSGPTQGSSNGWVYSTPVHLRTHTGE